MVAVGRTAFSSRAVAASLMVGGVMLSLADARAQTTAPAPVVPTPRASTTPKATARTPKPAPSKTAPNKPPAQKLPAATPPAATQAPAAPAPTNEAGLPAPQLLGPVDKTKPPPTLPRASREKMRGCAEEWDGLKRRTKVGDLTWRVFATKCLTR